MLSKVLDVSSLQGLKVSHCERLLLVLSIFMDAFSWKNKQRECGRTKHALIGLDSKYTQSGKIHAGGYATCHAGAGVMLLRYDLSHRTQRLISQSRLHGEVAGLPWSWIWTVFVKGRQAQGTCMRCLSCVFCCLFFSLIDNELAVFVVVVVPCTENHWGVSEGDTSGGVL